MPGPSYLGLTRWISWLLMPWSLRRQVISSQDIDYIEYEGPSVTRGRILSTCVISMWRNDTKCNYTFMFPLKKLARKGLNQWYVRKGLPLGQKEKQKNLLMTHASVLIGSNGSAVNMWIRSNSYQGEIRYWRVVDSSYVVVYYRQISNIRHTKSKKCFLSRLAVVFAQSIEARC